MTLLIFSVVNLHKLMTCFLCFTVRADVLVLLDLIAEAECPCSSYLFVGAVVLVLDVD
jgi:hypothetical protein